MNTDTWRGRRPCQRSRRRRTCSDHGVDRSTKMTTSSAKENNYWKHIYRLLSTYCRTKDLYASRK
uniref:Uncharacterized protein n=1 Tax=Arundo donax TaxID=35708 RepID=A0A0A9ACL9_ARUDO